MELPFNVDLSNKVVVITGGTGVLGSAMSMALAQSGAKVAMIGISEDADGLVDKIEKAGGTARVFLGDVTKKLKWKELKRS